MNKTRHLIGAMLLLSILLTVGCAGATAGAPPPVAISTNAPTVPPSPSSTVPPTPTEVSPTDTVEPTGTSTVAIQVASPAMPATSVPLSGNFPPVHGVVIEVHSGTFVKTVAPNAQTTMPFGNGPFFVVVHFPGPISPSVRPNLRAQIVPPVTGNWQIEPRDPPSDDSFAFNLAGGQADGSFYVQVSGYPQLTPIRFGLQMSQVAQVTLADDGQTLTINAGDHILLNLGAEYDWTVQISNSAILTPFPSLIPIPLGSQGYYSARRAGQVVLTATGEPACLKSTPKCGLPSRQFRLNINVLAVGAP